MRITYNSAEVKTNESFEAKINETLANNVTKNEHIEGKTTIQMNERKYTKSGASSSIVSQNIF